MKKLMIIFPLLQLMILSAYGGSPAFDSAEIPRMDRVRANGGKVEYDIRCTMAEGLSAEEIESIKEVSRWKVLGLKTEYQVSQVTVASAEDTVRHVTLSGNWSTSDDLTVTLDDNAESRVDAMPESARPTNWGFGKGKAVDFNAERLAEQRALYAFDYDASVKILERYLSPGGRHLWFRSASLNANSEGTFASDDTLRNGTQTSVDIGIEPYYTVRKPFDGGQHRRLMYHGRVSVGYQLETIQDTASNHFFEIVNKSFMAKVMAEIPWSNYPMYYLHTQTKYVRLAMPLTLSLAYVPKGKDGDDRETLGRIDFAAQYELAFSPYLIVQGDWESSQFTDAPAGSSDHAQYYSIAFAQDLDVVTELWGILGMITGQTEGDSPRGKHFVFYRISSGKRAPAFQDVREQSFGFGTYF